MYFYINLTVSVVDPKWVFFIWIRLYRIIIKFILFKFLNHQILNNFKLKNRFNTNPDLDPDLRFKCGYRSEHETNSWYDRIRFGWSENLAKRKRNFSKTEAKFFSHWSETELRRETEDFRCEMKMKQSEKIEVKQIEKSDGN